MPHATLKLLPGVDQNRTTALNEAAISTTNMVRFIPDKQGVGLVQKLGGWTKYFSSSFAQVIRALWSWRDTNSVNYLAVGCGTNPGAASDGLNIITNGSKYVITPNSQTANIAVSVTTGSVPAEPSKVLITASSSSISDYDSVDIQTQISIGGIILFGLYKAYAGSTSNEFYIYATNADGSPASPTPAGPGGAIPVFDFTNNSSAVIVTLANHGLQVGDTFTVLVPVSNGAVTISGNYIVQELIPPTTNKFRINIASVSPSTATVSMNSGNARYIYYKTSGPLPTFVGFGVGLYGSGGFGIGVSPVIPGGGTPIAASDWILDNWGQILLSSPIGKPIFYWDPISGLTQASIIPEAPSVNDGFFVAMPQRQIVAWGTTFNGIQDPLLIRWCDVENFNSWIALPANQAGSYRLPKGSKVVGCIQGPQQGLVWTDLGVWAMQYVGPPYVYQFNEIGNGCGLISRKAAASVNGIVYWMSQSQFFRLSGTGVEIIRCPIWDVIFQDIDLNYSSRIRIAPNSMFGEISWHYPTIGSNGTVTKYVKYNFILDQWDFGSNVGNVSPARTAWINQSVLGPPIGSGSVGNNHYIYQHEVYNNVTLSDADGLAMPSSFQTGYFTISNGEYKTFVDQFWPDMKWGAYDGVQDADLDLTFYVADYPHETARTYGPFAVNNGTDYITPRFRGRLVSFKMESNDLGSFWRIGANRYRFQPDGKF